MKLFFLMVQILGNVHYETPIPPAPRPDGTGTLLIAACAPGEPVLVTPGNYTAFASKQGIVEMPVAAQLPSDPSYRVNDKPLHGTIGKNETLSGVCP